MDGGSKKDGGVEGMERIEVMGGLYEDKWDGGDGGWRI